MAGTWTLLRVAASEIDLRDREPVVRPLTDADTPAIVACEVERSRLENGPLVRNDWLWKRLLRHPAIPIHSFGIDGPRGSGRLDALAVYRQAQVGAGNHYELVVRDWAALTPEAGRRLLSFLATHRSLCDRILLPARSADPLLLHLRETPIAVERRLFWMLRLVDAKAALEARGWPTGIACRVPFEVADAVVRRNAGRWTLDVADGRAAVRRGGAGRVRVDVRGLASLFSSHQSPTDLVRAGLLSGPERDLAALGTAFAGPFPWMAEIF